MKTDKLILTVLALLATFFGARAMQDNKQHFIAPCWATDKYTVVEFAKIPKKIHTFHKAYTTFQFHSENFVCDESEKNLHFNLNIDVAEPRIEEFRAFTPTAETHWLSLCTKTGTYQHHGGNKRINKVYTYKRPLIDLVDIAPCKQIFTTSTMLNRCISLKEPYVIYPENFSGACTTPDDSFLFVFLRDGTILKVNPTRPPHIQNKECFSDVVIHTLH